MAKGPSEYPKKVVRPHPQAHGLKQPTGAVEKINMGNHNSLTIGCVIVTHNRLDTLKVAVQTIREQSRGPDFTVVVDNNSSDGTRAWLHALSMEDPSVRPLLLDKNYGGAGGFHYGMKHAYEAGADWIWTLDDDSIPAKDALEQLLCFLQRGSDDESPEIGFLCSEVNWIDGSRHRMNVPGTPIDWTDGHPRVPGSSKICAATFVSTLISRKAIERVGYPVKEFFIWFDDVEFTLRISRNDFSNYYVPASKVTHVTEDNESGATYRNITHDNLLKYRIGSRNRVAFQMGREFGILHGIYEIAWMYNRMRVNRVPLGFRIRVLLAACRGFLMNYKKLIERPCQVRQAEREARGQHERLYADSARLPAASSWSGRGIGQSESGCITAPEIARGHFR